MLFDVAIIGGGASGLVAAIVARRCGANVVIIEKNQKVGKKILASGNGRCNLGNTDMSHSHFVSSDKGLMQDILERFSGEAALRFFRELGLEVVTEEGRVYPRSMQATAVLDVLLQELEHLGVTIATEARVDQVTVGRQGFEVNCSKDQIVRAKLIILAVGGKAGPQLGCTGDGYALATNFGHTVINPTPALVGLRLKNPYAKGLSGLRTQATVAIPEFNLSETGEVLFTDYGISGIPVFDLTRAIRKPQGLTLRLCITPDILTLQDAVHLLSARFKQLHYKQLGDALIGLLPRQLIKPVLTEAGLNTDRSAAKLKSGEITRLAEVMRELDFPIVDLNTWEQAQTTSGGVPLGEVHVQSLESKLVPGLYFAGEILDVHGGCGGYNLHWAWASGHIAGQSAGQRSVGSD